MPSTFNRLGCIFLAVYVSGALVTDDPRFWGAAAGTSIGMTCVAAWRYFRRHRRTYLDDDLYADVPGLVDSRTAYEPMTRADLERAFTSLDYELRHPGRLGDRLAASRARQRDRIEGVTAAERVAWDGLWHRLESDDDSWSER